MAAQEILSGRAELEIFDLDEISLYNDDVRLAGYPEPVERLREAVSAADALLFGVAEYNFGPSGVLKNAIDWASRPPGPPLAGKVFGMVGAATGGFGTVRGQLALRQILLFTQCLGFPGSFHVSNAREHFDEGDGRLSDDDVRRNLTDYLDGFLAFLQRVGV